VWQRGSCSEMRWFYLAGKLALVLVHGSFLLPFSVPSPTSEFPSNI
jgi:hypothetical protein